MKFLSPCGVGTGVRCSLKNRCELRGRNSPPPPKKNLSMIHIIINQTVRPQLEQVMHLNTLHLAGRCLLPLISDKGFLGRDTMMFLAYLVSAIYILILPFASYTLMAVATLVLGSFFGLSVVFFKSLVGVYLGEDRVKVAFGLIMFSTGLSFPLKPLFIGK